MLARLDGAIAAHAAAHTPNAVVTVLGLEVADGDADARMLLDGDVTTAAPAPAVTSSVRAQADRLAERIEAAHRALGRLRALDRLPLTQREALEAAVGDVARSLSHVRRSLRALGAELGTLEADGRALVARVFERRAGRAP
jgi:hypothetical protein